MAGAARAMERTAEGEYGETRPSLEGDLQAGVKMLVFTPSEQRSDAIQPVLTALLWLPGWDHAGEKWGRPVWLSTSQMIPNNHHLLGLKPLYNPLSLTRFSDLL